MSAPGRVLVKTILNDGLLVLTVDCLSQHYSENLILWVYLNRVNLNHRLVNSAYRYRYSCHTETGLLRILSHIYKSYLAVKSTKFKYQCYLLNQLFFTAQHVSLSAHNQVHCINWNNFCSLKYTAIEAVGRGAVDCVLIRWTDWPVFV